MRLLIPLLIVLVSACTPGLRKATNTALDVASTVCVLVRGTLEDGTVKTVCAAPEALIPLAKMLINSQTSEKPQGVENW